MATEIPTPQKTALQLCNYPGFFFLRSTVCLKGSPSVAKGTINFGSLLWGIWKFNCLSWIIPAKIKQLDYSLKNFSLCSFP